jgi:chromosome segregation ATPase
MKREDVKAKFPEMSDEDVKWLMDQHGAGLTREQNKARDLQTQLDAANTQLKTAQDGLKAFEGVDVKDLQQQIADLQGKLTAQADNFAFDSELDSAIRAVNGKNTKAIRALLDMDALKASKNRTEDIKSAIAELVKAEPWAFGTANPAPAPGTGGFVVKTGGEHGGYPGASGDSLFNEISQTLFPKTNT